MDWSDISQKSVVGDIVEWDIANWGRALQFWEESLPTTLDGQQVLTLGERNGGLSLMYALLGAQVTCTDYGGPTAAARELHERYGVQDRIQYVDIDATQIALPDQSFDIVGFKSMLGALQTWDRQQSAVTEMRRVLKPGGKLYFAENLRASPLHRVVRWIIQGDSWLNWRYVTPDELRTLYGDMAQFDMTTFGFASIFARWEIGRGMLHYFDRTVNPVVPESWNYVAFCVTTKKKAHTV
jgi:ubiquinone/menaquinone biosynthesis C-methylase UbiE